ncbi:MAG: GNAT family N-acetyltransferase [Glycomyces artemisiae]|uniref:GNAT family N-acetyltransferase n=1 Tax=Glycomyces artemisiae TaxID=1076443 RepID=A0A850CC95_9ACTN|nr:GNAT family N-acetyltransferase [Glycomyces artemisiae]
MISIRPVHLSDAAAVAELRRENRDHLAPWEPLRSDEHFTERGTAEAIANAIAGAEIGTGRSLVILDDGRITGQIQLNSIIPGAFQSCSIAYWVDKRANGKGIATEAVRLAKGVAFGELGLHRIQGETLVHNTGSQKVLERNGFVRYGLAPSYLKLAGRWQDHALYQVINPDAE